MPLPVILPKLVNLAVNAAKALVAITVNTDGSASYKAGNGGWSIVVKKGKELAELYGFSDRSTIGEMELLPIHNALEWLPIGSSPIRFFCDSQYVVNTLNVWALEWKRQGWFVGQLKRPSHWKLIKRIMELLDKHREHRAVAIIWIPREHNKHADKLAGEARRGRLTNYSL